MGFLSTRETASNDREDDTASSRVLFNPRNLVSPKRGRGSISLTATTVRSGTLESDSDQYSLRSASPRRNVGAYLDAEAQNRKRPLPRTPESQDEATQNHKEGSVFRKICLIAAIVAIIIFILGILFFVVTEVWFEDKINIGPEVFPDHDDSGQTTTSSSPEDHPEIYIGGPPAIKPELTDPNAPPTDGPWEEPMVDYYAESEDHRERAIMTVSSKEDVLTKGTPQRWAREWIMSHDHAKMEADDGRFLPRYIMAVLYYALAGDEWHMVEGWLGESDICLWRGICCMDDYFRRCTVGPLGPYEPKRIEIRLPHNNLQGSIPPEITKLMELYVLDLGSNRIIGTLPSDMEELENLYHLSLEDNGITGTVPSTLWDVPQLRTLSLRRNLLNGTALPSDGISKLRYVQNLDLEQNLLTGTIPNEIGALSKTLQHLSLSTNYLSGTLPPELYGLHELKSLRLGENAITGPFEDHLIAHWGHIRLIHLYQNDFTGTLPLRFGRLDKLESIQLHDNRFHGNIPPLYGSLQKLEYLYLDNNRLSGTIPDALYHAASLRYLDLYNNQLTGGIAPAISQLNRLVGLDVHNNSLMGTFPAGLSSIPTLKEVDIGQNAFGGPIDPTVLALPNLTSLVVSDNNLSGSPLDEHFDALALTRLDLEGNQFTGQIPLELLSRAKGLQELYLGNNLLEGQIPSTICSLPDIKRVTADCTAGSVACACCDPCT